MVRASQYLLLKFATMRLAHEYKASFDFGLGHSFGLIKVAIGPSGDHVRHIDGITSLAQQMIGASKRDEALWMLRADKDLRGILDSDQIISW